MTRAIPDGRSKIEKHITMFDTPRDLVQDPAKYVSNDRLKSIQWLELQVISSSQFHTTSGNNKGHVTHILSHVTTHPAQQPHLARELAMKLNFPVFTS